MTAAHFERCDHSNILCSADARNVSRIAHIENLQPTPASCDVGSCSNHFNIACKPRSRIAAGEHDVRRIRDVENHKAASGGHVSVTASHLKGTSLAADVIGSHQDWAIRLADLKRAHPENQIGCKKACVGMSKSHGSCRVQRATGRERLGGITNVENRRSAIVQPNVCVVASNQNVQWLSSPKAGPEALLSQSTPFTKKCLQPRLCHHETRNHQRQSEDDQHRCKAESSANSSIAIDAGA